MADDTRMTHEQIDPAVAAVNELRAKCPHCANGGPVRRYPPKPVAN